MSGDTVYIATHAGRITGFSLVAASSTVRGRSGSATTRAEPAAGGSIGGQPAAFIADGGRLYAALADGTVKRSTDGGRSWSVRVAP